MLIKIPARTAIFALIAVLSFFFYSCNSNLSGPEIVDQSITYHDPDNKWPALKASFAFEESRPGGPSRQSLFELNNPANFTMVKRVVDTIEVMYAMDKDVCLFGLNGNQTLTKEEQELHNVNCDRAKTMCNYYLYLWGLPMKLKDEGTMIHEKVEKVKFNNEDLLKVKVTYDPDIGSDTWYFYFDPTSFEMKGYQFFHDESKFDGEYITFQGIYTLGQNMTIPNGRSWYVNKDSTLLGTDSIVDAEIID